MILLRRPEVRYAEADGNAVWLVTDEGRLQAAVHGIDKLEEELAGSEFLRVHRRFLVNLSCIRAIDRGPRGEMSLIMDTRRASRCPSPAATGRQCGARSGSDYDGTRGRFIVR